MSEDDQGIEKRKRHGCNNAYVDRRNVGQVVVQNATPGWGGTLGRHGRYLPTVAWLTSMPRVGQAHPADQITNLVLIWGRPRRRDRHRQ
jgi:hypothetical protein